MKKIVENKGMQFALRIEKYNKKDKIFFDRSGDSNPRFLSKTFPPKIWIFREIRFIELGVLRTSGLYNTFKFWNKDLNSMTSVVGYQFRVHKIKIIFPKI